MLCSKNLAKNEIAQTLGLSIPTVSQALKELSDIGLVYEDAVLESVGGRKAQSYSAKKDFKLAIGIDITANHLNAVLVDLSGRIHYKERRNVIIRNDDISYKLLKSTVEKIIQDSGFPREAFLGVGLSIPGIVGNDGRSIYAMHEKMNISYDICDRMEEITGLPVKVENDANCACIAELDFECSDDDVLYFFISQTVGGAVFGENKIKHGMTRRAGEFGHITIKPNGRECYCGRRGCLNSYINTGLLAEQAGNKLESYFAGLEEGNEKYEEIWREYLDVLVTTLHNMLMSYDIPIVIGGYLGQYIDKYIPELKDRIERIDPYLKGKDFLRAASIKLEASATGAAMLFTKLYISEI